MRLGRDPGGHLGDRAAPADAAGGGRAVPDRRRLRRRPGGRDRPGHRGGAGRRTRCRGRRATRRAGARRRRARWPRPSSCCAGGRAPTIRADLAELSALSVGYFSSAEGREGVAAFREKRDPPVGAAGLTWCAPRPGHRWPWIARTVRSQGGARASSGHGRGRAGARPRGRRRRLSRGLPGSATTCPPRPANALRGEHRPTARSASTRPDGQRGDHRRGRHPAKLPERAIVVALATALQESKLENLGRGDRDSLGLFQQRPSQGWGTAEQISDPRYAATQVLQRAAQEGHGLGGDAGHRRGPAGAALRLSRRRTRSGPTRPRCWPRALTGQTPGAVTCGSAGEPLLRGVDAAAMLGAGLRMDWGNVETALAGGGVGLGVPAADSASAGGTRTGSSPTPASSGVQRVHFGTREWTADRGTWTDVPLAPTRPRRRRGLQRSVTARLDLQNAVIHLRIGRSAPSGARTYQFIVW